MNEELDNLIQLMSNDFDLGIELIKGQNIDVELLIDKVFELEDYSTFFKGVHIVTFKEKFSIGYFAFFHSINSYKNTSYNYPELKIILVEYINNLITK